MQKKNDLISIHELAKKYNVTPQLFYHYKNKYGLKMEHVPVRTNVFISETEFSKLYYEHTRKAKKATKKS